MKKEQSKAKENPFSDESPAYKTWEEKNNKNQPDNFKEIPNQKPNRLFAPFYNKESQAQQFQDVLSKLPKKYQFMLFTYIQQLISTLADGYQVESEDK